MHYLSYGHRRRPSGILKVMKSSDTNKPLRKTLRKESKSVKKGRRQSHKVTTQPFRLGSSWWRRNSPPISLERRIPQTVEDIAHEDKIIHEVGECDICDTRRSIREGVVENAS